MDKCWASSLNNCCDKISREHLISASLFKNAKSVSVQGFHWCEHQEKVVGLSSLTSNILCKNHNSILSDLDLSAGHAFNIFEDISIYTREAIKTNGVFKARETNINALNLERWLLKTLINITFGKEHLIGNGSEVGVPPENLVKICFGKSRFRHGAGMYYASLVGTKLTFNNIIKITPLIYKPDNRIEGAMFSFAGMELFLWLKQEKLPKDFSWLNEVYSDWVDFKPSRPFKRIKITIPSGDFHTVKFNW